MKWIIFFLSVSAIFAPAADLDFGDRRYPYRSLIVIDKAESSAGVTGGPAARTIRLDNYPAAFAVVDGTYIACLATLRPLPIPRRARWHIYCPHL